MVHALEVVTVQETITVPTNGENWGRIGSRMMNKVLAAYEALS
jgi:hypothetical protein